MTEQTEKKFYYHPNIFRLENLFFSFSYMIIILCWLFTLLLVDDYDYDRSGFIRFSIYFSLVIVLALNLLHIIVVTLRKTVFIVSERGVAKVSPGKIRVLQFPDILSFRYRGFILGNGFATIRTGKEKIRLPFGIEKLTELVELIQSNLTALNRQRVFRKEEITGLICRARLVEFTRDKTFFLLRQFLYTTVWGMLLSLVVSGFIWQLSLPFMIIWTFFGIMLVGLNDQITRYLYIRGVLKQLIRKPSELPTIDVSRIYIASSMVIMVIYLVCGILYRNFLGLHL